MTHSKENFEEKHDDYKAYDESDPYPFGRSSSQSSWNRFKHAADRLFSRTLDVGGDVAQRGIIEMEIAALRIRLKSKYSILGELVFQLKVAEERENVLAREDVQDIFEEIRLIHSQIASQHQKLQNLKEQANRDEYAGA